MLDKKAMINFKMLQAGQQIITIHISPNISRGKVNQTMKFDQLTEYDMRYNFIEKSYTNCG